ncbi:MAG: hypothetical protein ACRD4J_14180 [Nitrososphaeraceae archaeon]
MTYTMKRILSALLAIPLLIVPSQAYAYTIIEFAIADRPQTYQNVSYTSNSSTDTLAHFGSTPFMWTTE